MERGKGALNPEQAAAVYDRIGRLQDTQWSYERVAADAMVAAARLPHAHDVLEVGCGTGTLASRLLAESLPADARYTGIDVSTKMCMLSRQRLAPFGDRARVVQVDGRSPWPVDDATVDRVLAVYVLDLFSPDAIDAFVAETARVLKPGGLLAITSLSTGSTGFARALSSAWSGLWQLNAHLTGGCRPVDLDPHVPPGWSVISDTLLTSWGVCSRSLVLAPPPPGT